MLHCWKCRKLVSELPIKVAFRAECQHCGVPLHTCTGCRYYSPGKPNDCAVPGTDYVRDREAMNFCEEFAPIIKPQEGPKAKNSFNSLFKDEK